MTIAADAFLSTGEKIRFLRKRRGWSQEELAGRAGVKLATLQEAEAGKRNPQFRTIQKIAAAMRIEPEELASSHCALITLNGTVDNKVTVSLVTPPDALASITADATQLSTSVENETVRLAAQIARIAVTMNRREFMQAIALAGAESEDFIRSIQYGLEGRKVGSEVVTWAREQIATLSRLDDLMGGKQLYPIARANLELLQNLLQMRGASGRDEQELRLTLAHMARLSGWLAQDAGYDNIVGRHYRLGIEISRSIGDYDFAAYCIAMMAFHAVDNGSPEQCLTLLEAAQAEAAKEAPLQIALKQWSVQPLGLLDNRKAAAQSLIKADSLWGQRDSERLPEYLYWLWQPSNTPEVPRGFIDHDPQTAIRLLESGLKAVDSDFQRDKVLFFMGLAEARHSAGQSDEALAEAAKVLDFISTNSTSRALSRLIKFSQKLPDDQSADEFKARIAAHQRLHRKH